MNDLCDLVRTSVTSSGDLDRGPVQNNERGSDHFFWGGGREGSSGVGRDTITKNRAMADDPQLDVQNTT